MDQQPWLILALILVPLLSALAMLVPNPWFDDRRNSWTWALVSTALTFLLSVVVAFQFDWAHTGVIQFVGEVAWVPAFGLTFSYGIDTISLWLVLLTTFLMPIVILGSLTAVGERFREYYFWLLILTAAMIGTFVATDLIFFYVCFEFTLVPLYFLIGIYGSSDRLKAARVFFLYTFAGSMLTFAGLIYVAWFHATLPGNEWTFNIQALYESARQMSFAEQSWVLLAMLAGFAVKVPVWPVHTWLPLAHTEAPTAGSVVLAGVLLKLGTYAILRFALPMTPEAIVVFAPWIGVVAVIGIVYTALVCWVQQDIKKLIAYSSVSHLGFCVLGLFALDATNIGGVGAVMYMVNHGLSTGALFLCVGMIYERFHTREMSLMGGLGRVMPIWATFTGFFVMASVGLPGLNGFVSEFLTLMATFLSPAGVLGVPYAIVAGLALIFTAMYLLYMTGKVLFGPTKVPEAHHDDEGSEHHVEHRHGKVADLNGREILTLLPLAASCLVLGVVPFPVLQSLEDPVENMLAAAKEQVDIRNGATVEAVRGPATNVVEEPAGTMDRQWPSAPGLTGATGGFSASALSNPMGEPWRSGRPWSPARQSMLNAVWAGSATPENVCEKGATQHPGGCCLLRASTVDHTQQPAACCVAPEPSAGDDRAVAASLHEQSRQ